MKIKEKIKYYNPKILFLYVCAKIDKLVFLKFKIEVKHSYKRIRVYPNKEAWKVIKRELPDAQNYESSKDFSFYQNCLMDNDTVVIQRTNISGKKNTEFEEKVNDAFLKEIMQYVDSHLYFSLFNYFLQKLYPVKNPFKFYINGQCYESSEEDIVEI